jgi:phosphatidylglycerophosphate synthase
VRPLVHTPIRPNHLTTLRLVTGIAAAVAFAFPAPEWQAEGIAILIVSLLLDRADGELARLSGRISRSGHRYDLVADGISNGAVFVGIGAGLAHGAFGHLALALGIIAGVSFLLAEFLLMRLDRNGVKSTANLGGRWGFDPDDAMFLVPLVLAFGWGETVLVAAAIAAPAVVVLFLTLGQRTRPAEEVQRNASDIG